MDTNKFDVINEFLQQTYKTKTFSSQQEKFQQIESIKEEDDDPKPDPQFTPSISVQRHKKQSTQPIISKPNTDNNSIKSDISEISSQQQRLLDKSFNTTRILHQLREYSSGYTNSNIKTHSDLVQATVTSTSLLKGVSQHDTEDDIGRKLYDDLTNCFRTFGDLFMDIIENNFDDVTARRECFTSRKAYNSSLTSLEELSNRQIREVSECILSR